MFRGRQRHGHAYPANASKHPKSFAAKSQFLALWSVSSEHHRSMDGTTTSDVSSSECGGPTTHALVICNTKFHDSEIEALPPRVCAAPLKLRAPFEILGHVSTTLLTQLGCGPVASPLHALRSRDRKPLLRCLLIRHDSCAAGRGAGCRNRQMPAKPRIEQRG